MKKRHHPHKEEAIEDDQNTPSSIASSTSNKKGCLLFTVEPSPTSPSPVAVRQGAAEDRPLENDPPEDSALVIPVILNTTSSSSLELGDSDLLDLLESARKQQAPTELAQPTEQPTGPSGILETPPANQMSTTSTRTRRPTAIHSNDRVHSAPGAFSMPGPAPGMDRQSDEQEIMSGQEISLVVVAEVVDEREREERMRNQILSSAVVAHRVVHVIEGDDSPAPTPGTKQRRHHRRTKWALSLFAVLVVTGVVVGIAVTRGRTSTPSSVNSQGSNVTDRSNTDEPTYRPSSSSQYTTYATLGRPIDLESLEEQYSYEKSTALNGDGTVFAVAYNQLVKVYEYHQSNDSWTSMGQVLFNPNNSSADPYVSTSYYETPVVSLSSSGRRLAGSAPAFENNTGRVRVFEYDPDSSRWAPMGSQTAALVGNRSRGDGGADKFGHDVKLSGDGTVLAVAASNYDNYDVNDKGYANVYVWKNETATPANEWELLDRVPGIYSPSQLSLALSGDGQVVALGDVNDATAPGTVRLWTCTADDGCSRYGTDIQGADYEDMAGSDLSLSYDGAVVAVAAPGSYECEGRPYCGNVRTYDAVMGTEADWVQLGQMIQGDMGFGMRIQLSSDGQTLAAYNVGNTTQIYQVSSGAWRSVLERPINGSFLSMSSDASVLAVDHKQDGSVRLLRLEHSLAGNE